jgi:hypothetical protein
MEWDVRDLLDRAVGEPPVTVSLAAVRRRGIRRRITQAGVAGVAAAVAIALGATLSAGAISTGGTVTAAGRPQAGPPPFYIAQDAAPGGSAVRSTTTGQITAEIRTPDPEPGKYCGNNFAAADGETFFMECSVRTSAGQPESMFYRFRLNSAGKITGYSLVKGSVLHGYLGFGMAVSPDGTELATEVARPGPSGRFYTNTIPAGIFVISTITGHRAFWRNGPYRPGKLQYAGSSDLSFTKDGSELVADEARCPRTRTKTECTGNEGTELRAYYPADGGGSLEGGRVLLLGKQIKPAGTFIDDGRISPDGSTLLTVLNKCPRKGACTVKVESISVTTHRVLHVLFRALSGTRWEGVGVNLYCTDPSGRYLIFEIGDGKNAVSGLIDNGKIVPIPPGIKQVVSYEAW